MKTKFQNDLNDHSLDPLYGKRIHCWVIIIPSETKDQYTTSEPYFIEPSTSEQKDIANENYIGIEAIWNQKNFWVNLQALEGGCSVRVNDGYSIFMLYLIICLQLICLIVL